MQVKRNLRQAAVASTVVLGLFAPILTSVGIVRAVMSQSSSAEVVNEREVNSERTGIGIPQKLQEAYLTQVSSVLLSENFIASFKSRVTAPTTSNGYYFSQNVFYQSGYGMPNCTAYAWGRAYEILDSRPNLSTGNAYQWWDYNVGKYASGQTPQLGAVACWGHPEGGGYGHVAIVEEINGDTLTISESSWDGFFFRTRQLDKNSMGAGFQGYIYLGNFSTTSASPPVKLPVKNLAQAISVGINYETHVSKVGWMNNVADGALSGSTGYGLAVEALRLSSGNASIDKAVQYRAHVQDIGWQDWQKSGQIAGTTGQTRRVEAVEIILNNGVSDYYDIEYRAHVQNIGWQGWMKNGQTAGTTGQSKRIEALQFKLVPKNSFQGSPNPSNTEFSYRSHIQDFGWLGYVEHNAVSGTVGIAKRLEAFELLYQGRKEDIQIEGHVQGIGWQKYLGAVGTTGQEKRLEAVKINFKDDLSKKYTVKYRVHVQNIGWQEWQNEGEVAGTTGQSKRIEAIQFQFIPK
ncbi:hypothetical protein RyT2_03960 [Pseudolactococcus yaeyamensis]